MSSLKALVSDTPGLSLVSRDDEPGFLEAISCRAFNSRGIPSDVNDPRLPDAVLTATTVEAVQAAVTYCASESLKLAVRSGGHSWHTSWLHGKGSILLDVGDMKDVSVNVDTKTASFGPGAKDILQKLPDGLFYPSGHCAGVPAGGYILGGGFGLAFTKYGATSMLVTDIQAVLASGKVVEASKEEDSQESKALFSLLKGSYSGFPAVITRFTVQLLPAPVALLGMFFFELKEWRRVLRLLLDMQWKGDEDVASVESTMCLCYAPPPLAEATGVDKVAMIIMNIWGDTEQEAHRIYSKFTKDLTDTMVPPEEPKIVSPVEVTQAIGQMYPPTARYACQAFLGDSSLHEKSYSDIEELLEPIVEMHITDFAPPPSHTILAAFHPRLKAQQHHGQDLVFGFSPSFLCISNAIYQDASMDDAMETRLKNAYETLVAEPSFKMEMAEGNVAMTGASRCFTEQAYTAVQEQIHLLDPSGVFAGFHDK